MQNGSCVKKINIIKREKNQILERKSRNYLQIRSIWKTQVHKTQ